ncbi:MAG: hypothetical protein AB8H47_04490 [Bacteroidia bacterium]
MRSKTFRQIIWFLALLSQLWQTDHFFTYAGPDRNLQMLATKTYLESGDWCIPQQSEDGPSCETLTGWPPAFGVLIAGFYQITGDWFMAVRWFNGVGVLLVFVAMHFLLMILDRWLSPWVYPLLFIFWGISFSPFYYTFGIEEWALASFLLASISSVSLWQSKRWHWAWWILLGLSIGIGFSMRYAYAPLGILLLMPIVMGRLKERQWRMQAALSSLGLMAIGMGSFVLLTPTTSNGDSWFELLQSQQLYLENLLHFDAFPLKAWAFFSLDGFVNKFGATSPGLITLAKVGLLIASLALLYFLWRLFRESSIRSGFGYLQANWWVLILSMVFFLTVLSVLVPPEMHDDQWYWTWVKETRYYAPLLIIVQVLTLQWATERSAQQQNKWSSMLGKGFLLVAFAYSGLHTAYRLIGNPEHGSRWTSEEQNMIKTFTEIQNASQQGQFVWWQEGKSIAAQDMASIAGLAGARIIPYEQRLMITPPENAPIMLLPQSENIAD